jgi:hypothetical protein
MKLALIFVFLSAVAGAANPPATQHQQVVDKVRATKPPADDTALAVNKE